MHVFYRQRLNANADVFTCLKVHKRFIALFIVHTDADIFIEGPIFFVVLLFLANMRTIKVSVRFGKIPDLPVDFAIQ